MAAMTRIGKLEIEAPFYQAGLAGYSDAAMRLIARKHGCPYCVTEAMLDTLLVSGGKGRKIAELTEADHPTAGQIMGAEPQSMAKAARILVEYGHDVIDVNLACPVKKIRKKSRGGHLLTVPDQAVAILDAVKQAVGDDRPCSVKLRRASDDTPDAEANFHKVIQGAIELGYAAATVHGRTVKQKYIGPSHWSALRDIARQYGQVEGFTLGGSGDIWKPADVKRMLEETGVHMVSVARGCIGNPWFFEQSRALLAGDMEKATQPPTVHQQRDVLLEHFELSVGLHGETRASMMMRKFGIRFSRHHPQADAVRERFIRVGSLADWHEVLREFYTADSPGRSVEQAVPDEAEEASCEPVGSEVTSCS